MLLYGLFTKFGENTHPESQLDEGDATDHVQQTYASFIHLHSMVFLGFGFFMTFLRTSQWSAITFNFVLSAWALEWAILSTGFWHQIIMGIANMDRIDLNIDRLILGDYGAAAAMITLSVLIGKCNLVQMFFLILWEMVFFGLNWAIIMRVGV